MALGDITILEQASMTGRGGRVYNVAASTNVIYPGEPVVRALGAAVVATASSNQPVVGTSYWAGIAATQSTNTSSAAGTVEVFPLNSSTTYLISPKAPTSWDTQAEYDALVGSRVLIDLTAGSFTILASDSANNGCVVMPLDIAKYPGKVAFALRAGASDVA